MKNKPKSEKKVITLREVENQLKLISKVTKAGGILGLILGTGSLAAGIFLPKEINETLEKVIEFSLAGFGYVSAVGFYGLYRANQIRTTQWHMRPEYQDALQKSLTKMF